MSKKTDNMRSASNNPLMGTEVSNHVQRDNSGSNADKPVANIMAKRIEKNNPGAQLFDAKNKTIAGVPFTDYSLDVPNNITEEQFDQLAEVLFSLDGRLQIYIGDMLNAMDDLPYGDIKELAAKYHREPETFYKLKSVLGSVKTFLRRKVYESVPNYKKTLTATHFELVMTLDEDRQFELLRAALEQGMSVSQLRYYKTHGELPDPNAEVVRRTDKDIIISRIEKWEGELPTKTKKERKEYYERLMRLAKLISGDF